MDCRRMTGSMKITINRLRDAASRKGGSGLAEAAHKTMPLITQGSTASADRQTTMSRERAKLDAYNRQLATRNCKTLDIDAELAARRTSPCRSIDGIGRWVPARVAEACFRMMLRPG